MMVSTPTKDYTCSKDYSALRGPSMSPSYRARHCTPPRLVSTSSDLPSYDSPMLTPSPLRQRPLFPNHFSSEANDPDDLFLQSPYKSPAPALHSLPPYNVKPQSIAADDDEGSIFLSSSPSFSPFFPASSSQPLRTPVKQMYRAPSRSALSVKHLNTLGHVTTNMVPADALPSTTRVGIGTKRKSTSHGLSTPVRQHNLSPLTISATTDSANGSIGFDRLAPLAPPKFTTATPHTKAETDAYLRKHTASLTKLRISDLHEPIDSSDNIDNDSGCEMDDEMLAEALFTGTVRLKGSGGSLGKASGKGLLNKVGRGKKAEVVEAISPGGHVIKRRARSRPVSAELIGSVQRSPTSPSRHGSYSNRQREKGIAFPSISKYHRRSLSGSSESESGSPLPRRRVGNIHPHPYPPKFNPTSVSMLSRPTLNRQENISSATLFFGPAIPPAVNCTPAVRSRTNTGLSVSTPAPSVGANRAKTVNRHSYAGPGSNGNLASWNAIQSKDSPFSPQSSPPANRANTSYGSIETEEDIFFNAGPQDSSFIFSVTEGTPSPRSKKFSTTTLPKKYKPRDSGIVLSDDEDDHMSISGDFLNIMPSASTSVGSIHSDLDDNLITPGFGPDSSSGWPSVFVTGADETGAHVYDHLEPDAGVDAFIMRTLAAAAKYPQNGKKKVPGTPVKKMKTAYLSSERPWQSAVAAKVGIRFDWENKKGKAPRKSLPAAFPVPGKKREKLGIDPGTDSEGEEDSPSGRKTKYAGIGIGRPSDPSPHRGHLQTRTRWLMRRSSSGAFSSGSDTQSSASTPTRIKGKDWQLPSVPTHFSPSRSTFGLSPVRSASGSSNSSVATLNSPSVPSVRRHQIPAAQRANAITRRSSQLFSEEQSGRFAHDFVEIDEVGSGEFGKVIKVRCKNGDDCEVYAVKKSKRFEGVRHRLRLREEVEILKHLSHAALSMERNRHPNVLAYIDSWEEDEALYIRTELCESGNLARFLWEYGRVFPRLDEGRVWKVVVDLSNGLRFIHEAGVIHLDLKPSNVFVTGEGRFKIGDFGMASLWPRPTQPGVGSAGGFEREGDKLYLAPEVLQGNYSKAADVFSFGMTILETASNIVVPDQGEAWQRLRREDFSQVDLDDSPELLDLIRQMMRTDPSMRLTVHAICDHPVVSQAREIMESVYLAAKRDGTSLFAASPLAGVHGNFLKEILGRRVFESESGAMDVSP